MLIGSQSCNCTGFRTDGEPCVHILWIMLRKLRVPATNALAFQKCLVDREVTQLLQGTHLGARLPRSSSSARSESSTSASKAPAPTAKHRPPEEGEVCPICQDGM